ncbi:M20/M25/M40 family metallo-hydrolase [Haloplanus pelagicus]|uniref:M20/M25/M40 family metallo-hydrolase n=1 Tax=Haloplanus pelagicus TaxID=2949995 RepID=UPI00203CCC83|nr:M20/M25/M40 family metallo-hydrolase [Haloplanus sp. HW8-1]
MEPERRAFLDRLLETPSPSGFETRGQRVWLDYVSEFADEIHTDDYGNAVAVHHGDADTAFAMAGHADEVGFIVRRIDDDGYVRIGAIGGADRTVSQGQHVTIHGDDPVAGVIGQTAIHLRETGEEEYDDVGEQYVDVGATDREAAEALVSVGDPVTFSTTVEELHGSRLAARGIDDRVGTWAVAEGLRRAVAADVEATVYAVSTIQEEVGLQGARMVGVDLAPDAVVAVDVTHATDSPGLSEKQRGPVELGAGPVVTRGSANHPVLVELARDAATEADVDVQLQAAGTRTGTDADAFYTSAGGTPTLNLGLPNRYMHTPVEVIDETDLRDAGALLGAMARRAAEREPFAVDV